MAGWLSAYVGAGSIQIKPDSASGTARRLGANRHPITLSATTIPTRAARSVRTNHASTFAIPVFTVAPSRFLKPALGGASISRVLMWFQADLRVEDNEALNAAATAAKTLGGALVPIYSARDQSRAGAAQELRSLLQHAGSDLVTLSASGADLGERLVEIAHELRLEAVYYNRAGLADDEREQSAVLDALQNAGIQTRMFWGNSLCGTPTRSDLCPSALAEHVSDPNVVGALRSPESRLPALSSAARNFSDSAVDALLAPKIGSGTSAGLKLLAELDGTEQALSVGRSGSDVAIKFRSALNSGALSLRMCFKRVCELTQDKPRGYLFTELVFRSYMCSVLNKQAARAVAPVC